MCKSESWSVSGYAAREPLGQWGTHAAALPLLPSGRKLRSPPAELGHLSVTTSRPTTADRVPSVHGRPARARGARRHPALLTTHVGGGARAACVTPRSAAELFTAGLALHEFLELLERDVTPTDEMHGHPAVRQRSEPLAREA